MWSSGSPCTLSVELLTSFEYDLQEGESVYAYVLAKNRIGNSPPSAIGNGAEIPSRPCPPEAPTLVTRAATSIQVTWELGCDGGLPITSCSVWWLDQSDLSSSEQGPFDIDIAALDNRQYTATGLTSGNQYRFQVACENIAGLSARSAPASFMAGVTPEVVTLLSERYDCRSVTTLGVEWKEPEDNGAIGILYNIYIHTRETDNEEDEWQHFDTATYISDTAYCHDSIMSHYYRYEVTAFNAIGESDKSDELVLQAGDVPCPPREVETDLVDDGQSVKITWLEALCDNGLEIQGYQVFLRNGDFRPIFDNVAYDCEENTSPEDRRENVVFGSCTVPVGMLYNELRLEEGDVVDAQVITVNAAGFSDPGRGAGAFVPEKAEIPGSPTQVQLIGRGDGEISIAWIPPIIDGGARILNYEVIYGIEE